MDRQNFISDTLTKVHTEGFNGDPDSVIALLIFALGEVAIVSSTRDLSIAQKCSTEPRTIQLVN
jgi:hypothetical protein